MVSAPDMVFLRAGHVQDLDAVMAIMERAFAPCFGEAWTRSQCAGILPMYGVTLTIAHRGAMAIGFALARSVMDEAELLLLAVDPEAQGAGVGHQLLQHFIRESRKSGASTIHLEVRDGNSAAHLYSHAGFHIVGRRREYYKNANGDRYDALTMALPATST